ncbi:MAG: transposase [Prevotella sp.]|nr:transposase [Prevotella sp.]
MSRSRKQISEEFKLSVIRDYYSSGMSKSACRRKYQLSSPTMLNSWLKKYGNEENVVPLQTESDEEEMSNRSKDSYKDENAQLRKRIKELEKALEFSRLETLSRDMMIDKAEEYFDISIRKKSGAK